MTTEIKTETFTHPETKGSITRDYIYTKDDEGNVINKEFYVPQDSEATKLIKVLQSATIEEIQMIKDLLKWI